MMLQQEQDVKMCVFVSFVSLKECQESMIIRNFCSFFNKSGQRNLNQAIN